MAEGATTPRAERGYSWPPFENGNAVAVKHGAFSDRVIDERAKDVLAKLEEIAPHLAQPLFDAALRRYLRVEARALLVSDHIFKVVEESGVEAVRPYLWDVATRADTLAQKAAQDLGLDPAGHARISRDLGMAQIARQQVQRGSGGPALGEKGRAIRIAKGRLDPPGGGK